MGYEIHITRADSWFESESAPILKDEYLELVTDDPELKLAGFNGPTFSIFADSVDPYGSPWLDWLKGEIYSKAPTGRLLLKMVDIAQRLGARVQGDDLEVYATDSPELADYLKYEEEQSRKH